MERLLTTEDVAELLRIDPVTVRRLIMRGELPAYRIAGEYRFTSADVKQFVESQRVMVNFPNKNQFSDKFTNEARTVLALASEEALRYNHTRVGTEHLVLALLRDGEGIAARALNQSHIQEHEIRQRIETQHPEELDHPAVAGPLGITSQTKASIEQAVQEGAVSSWKGIPYAQPPVGVLRFRAPQPPQVRSGVYDATQFGPMAMQPPRRYPRSGYSPPVDSGEYRRLWWRSTPRDGIW